MWYCWLTWHRHDTGCRQIKRKIKDADIVRINCFNSHQVYKYIYPTASLWAGCDTRSIFKRIIMALISEFFFSKIGCLTKTKELSLSYSLAITGRRDGFIFFPMLLRYVKCKQPRPGFELESPCPFPTMITIISRAPPESVYMLLTHTCARTHTHTHTHRGVMANVLDCDIIVYEFELQSRHYIHFWTNTFGKGMNTLTHHL